MAWSKHKDIILYLTPYKMWKVD